MPRKAKKVEGKTKTKFDIRDYKKMLQQGDYLIETLVYVGKFKIQPWEDCVVNKTNNVNINWWKAYNSIKHSGKPNFSQATLKNAFSCMAGMFALLTMYDFKIMTNTMVNWRRLFSYAGNYYNNVSWKCNLVFNNLIHQIKINISNTGIVFIWATFLLLWVEKEENKLSRLVYNIFNAKIVSVVKKELLLCMK